MAKARIAVIGSGLMGHGIAQVFALAGHDVTITDSHKPNLDTVKQRIATNLRDLGDDLVGQLLELLLDAEALELLGRGDLLDELLHRDVRQDVLVFEVDEVAGHAQDRLVADQEVQVGRASLRGGPEQ